MAIQIYFVIKFINVVHYAFILVSPQKKKEGDPAENSYEKLEPLLKF